MNLTVKMLENEYWWGGASATGEPIVRHMEYEYPHCGYAKILDQFFLGLDVLVAPVTEKGATQRDVVLPEGRWVYCDGQEYPGGQRVTVKAEIQRLPYFTRNDTVIFQK